MENDVVTIIPEADEADQELNQERDRLMELSQAADSGEAPKFDENEEGKVEGEQKTGDETGKTELDKEKKEESTKTETPEQKAQRERDEQGRFKKTEKKPEVKKPEGANGTEDGKQDSEYVKKQKETERFDRNWKKLNDDQAEVRRLAEELKSERDRIARESQVKSGQQLPRAHKDGFFADDYYKAAQDFSKDGDHKNAFKAMAAFHEIRDYETRAWPKLQEKAVLAQWDNDMISSLQKEENAAFRDPQSDEAKGLQQLISEYPWISRLPQGFQKGMEIVGLRMKAAKLDSLQTDLNEAKKEIERLNKALQPAGGGPTQQPTTKTFDDMSLEEMGEDLRRRTAELEAA